MPTEWSFGIALLENLLRPCGGEVIPLLLFSISYLVVLNLSFSSCFKPLHENEA